MKRRASFAPVKSTQRKALESSMARAAATFARYADVAGNDELWLRRALARVQEADVAPSILKGHQTQADVEALAEAVCTVLSDRATMILDSPLWRYGDEKVGVVVTMLPSGDVHVAISPMETFAEFADQWMRHIDRAGKDKPGSMEWLVMNSMIVTLKAPAVTA